MITVSDSTFKGDTSTISLIGLSGDDKPTGTFNDRKIGNGSTFFEMDTLTVKFYDAESDTWVG